MKNLRNRINLRPVNNEKYYLKWASKPSYMSHKLFDNNLVVIRKTKVTLKLNKPAYTGMCILELSKVLIYDSITITTKRNMTKNQNYYSQTYLLKSSWFNTH